MIDTRARYRLGEVLGRGAFGVTYAAFDTRLGREVAIKEVSHPEMVEAAALARFSHPGIVRVYDVFEDAGRAYVVMELLRGRHPLGPMAWTEAVRLTLAVGAALAVVHRAGLLHRDVKPGNVVLTDDGRVVLVDFGAARAFAGASAEMTQLLTPGYAPLEQYTRHGPFGPATDVYALGGFLYHLLTGRCPPPATDRASGTPLPSIGGVPPTLDAAVAWALALDPAARPQSVEAFLTALRPVPTQPFVHRDIRQVDVPVHKPVGPAAPQPFVHRDIRQVDAPVHKPMGLALARSLGPVPWLAAACGAILPVATVALAVGLVLPVAASVTDTARADRHRRARRGRRWWDRPGLAVGVAGRLVPTTLRGLRAALGPAVLAAIVGGLAILVAELSTLEGTVDATTRAAQAVAGGCTAFVVASVARRLRLGWPGGADGTSRLVLWGLTIVVALLALGLRLTVWPLPFGP